MLVWDNQQVTSNWFAGMLEGEGSFRNTAKSNIEVRLCNTDIDLIEACERYLKQHHIYYIISEDNRATRKVLYTLRIAKSREILHNYPQLLYNLLDSKLQCRHKEYQRILGTSETERDLSADFDWMIGVFEAEGSFSLIQNNRERMALKIDISNTNYKILEKFAITLKHLGCSWYVENKSRELHWQDAKAICICGMKRCLRFLNATNNKWQSKRNLQRSSLMLEFIHSRLPKNQKEPYTERELQIPNIMKQLNTKGG